MFLKRLGSPEVSVSRSVTNQDVVRCKALVLSQGLGQDHAVNRAVENLEALSAWKWAGVEGFVCIFVFHGGGGYSSSF
jgi:hypothetical protein